MRRGLPPPKRHFRSGRGSAGPALKAWAPCWFWVPVLKQDGGWRPPAPAQPRPCPTPGDSVSRPPQPLALPAPLSCSLYPLVPRREARAQGPPGRCPFTRGAACAPVHRSLSEGAVRGRQRLGISGTGGDTALPPRFTAAPFAAGGRPSLGCDAAAPRSGKARPRGFCTAKRCGPGLPASSL